MALLNKIFAHVGKKKDTRSGIEHMWESYSSLKPVKVRVVLFRDTDSKGKKLLFDSNAVKRETLREEENQRVDAYTEVNDGYGFTYLPPGREVKMYSEMILGSVAVSHNPGNMKLHSLEEGRTLMWSSVVQASKISQGVKSSDSSLTSSFGCSLGSFNQAEAEELGFGVLPENMEQNITSVRDSGCFPSYPSSANIASFISNESATDLRGLSRRFSRRLSSNVDMPDYGSLCSLQRRYLSTIDPSSPFKLSEDSQGSLPVFPTMSFQKETHSKSELSSVGSQSRKNTLLGLGILVEFPNLDSREIFLSHCTIIEDIFSHLLQTVQQGYARKKRFVITVHSGYLDCVRMIEDLYCVPRLKLSAWHLSVKDNTNTWIQDQLVSDICMLNRTLNTKETNFVFSTLVTGILTHHLGWVSTVMPGSKPGVNLLHKPRVQGLDQFRNEQWYDPTKVQFSELHGMLGSPIKFAKSLILSNKESLSKTLIFVLSYFVRCSLVYQNKYNSSNSGGEVKYVSCVLRECPRNSATSQTLPAPLGKSSSSPRISQRFHAEVNTIEALDLSASTDKPIKSQAERVGFQLGADDSSPVMEPCQPDLEKKGEEQGSYSKDEVNEIYLTNVPFSEPELLESSPADSPSLICCGNQFMPGSALQACSPDLVPQWKSFLRADLLAVAGNSQVCCLTEECVCVVADIDTCEVSLVSAQQVVVGRPGLPVPMSPMVANLLDNFNTIVDLGLSTEDCLNYMEDQLQQIYLESCSLSEYLLSADYTSLQNISKNLQVDPCDIPLLLAVASTHTPAVGKKLSLGFTG